MPSEDDSCPTQDSRIPKRFLSGPESCLPVACATAASLSPATALHRSSAATSPAAAPILSTTVAPWTFDAARIPARSPPADIAHSSASLVPPAAPSLRSTPSLSAGANPSGARSAPGIRRRPRSLRHLHVQAQLVEAGQVHWRHFHHRYRRNGIELGQQLADRLLRDRRFRLPLQQFAQSFIHLYLAFLGRQLQNLQVLFARSARRRFLQRIVDRKSTRLNSSHRCISYALFCFEKKKKKKPCNITETHQPRQKSTARTSHHP